MKKIFFSIMGFAILAAVATFFYQRRPAVPVAVVAPAPLSTSFENAMAEQMPPEQNGGRFPAVNRQRLQTLAGSDYEGPSYTADYSRYEMIAAQKQGSGGRLPASEKKLRKSPKTK